MIQTHLQIPAEAAVAAEAHPREVGGNHHSEEEDSRLGEAAAASHHSTVEEDSIHPRAAEERFHFPAEDYHSLGVEEDWNHPEVGLILQPVAEDWSPPQEAEEESIRHLAAEGEVENHPKAVEANRGRREGAFFNSTLGINSPY